MMKIIMIIIQFIMTSYQKKQKEKTGKDKKQMTASMTKDLAKLKMQAGISAPKLAKAVGTMGSNKKQTSITQVKESEQQMGKIWGYSRPSKTVQELYPGSTQVKAETSVNAIPESKMKIYFPFSTENFEYADIPTSVKIICGNAVSGILGTNYEKWTNQIKEDVLVGKILYSKASVWEYSAEAKAEEYFRIMSFFQKASIGGTSFKQITKICLETTHLTASKDVNSVCMEIIKDSRISWTTIINGQELVKKPKMFGLAKLRSGYLDWEGARALCVLFDDDTYCSWHIGGDDYPIFS